MLLSNLKLPMKGTLTLHCENDGEVNNYWLQVLLAKNYSIALYNQLLVVPHILIINLKSRCCCY